MLIDKTEVWLSFFLTLSATIAEVCETSDQQNENNKKQHH